MADYIHILLQLALVPGQPENRALVEALDPRQQEELISLARKHHVTIRALGPVAGLRDSIGKAVSAEKQRASRCLEAAYSICSTLDSFGCAVTVIKSLDHWPDMGTDLDLFTDAPAQRVIDVMQREFRATVEPASWSDQLAHKINFRLPGLNELVEVHVGRLGQTGEHTVLADRLMNHRRLIHLEGRDLIVASAEDQIILAVLQRLYRHYFLRVCDVVNTATLIEKGAVNWKELRSATQHAGIWPGTAAYLRIVADYVRHYRAESLRIPGYIFDEASFGGEKVYPRAEFLRVPLLPQGAYLYARQLIRSIRRRDARAAARLTLVAPLALAAGISYKIRGHDKGVW